MQTNEQRNILNFKSFTFKIKFYSTRIRRQLLTASVWKRGPCALVQQMGLTLLSNITDRLPDYIRRWVFICLSLAFFSQDYNDGCICEIAWFWIEQLQLNYGSLHLGYAVGFEIEISAYTCMVGGDEHIKQFSWVRWQNLIRLIIL